MKHIRTLPLLAALAVSAMAGTASAALPSPDDPSFQIPKGQVEHTITTVEVEGSRAVPRSERIERWMSRNRARTVIRDMKTGKVVREITYAPGETRVYDAQANTLTITREARTKRPPWTTAAYQAALQRAYVADGFTKVTGEKTVDGRRALVVESVPGRWRSDEPASRTVSVVDAETYALYERVTGLPGGVFGETETVEVSELLSASGKVNARMAMTKRSSAKVKRKAQK